jgi:hypothetical protein
MNQQVLSVWNEVAVDLGRQLDLRPPLSEISPRVPPPLVELYSVTNGGDAVIGYINGQAELLESVEKPPFGPEWLSFGADHYGVFWLCRTASQSGLWFTTWDHDLQDEIDGPVFSTLAEFFRDTYESALDLRDGGNDYLVITTVPERSRSRAALEVKALASLSTASALASISIVPARVPIASATVGKKAVETLPKLGVSCHLNLEFF